MAMEGVSMKKSIILFGCLMLSVAVFISSQTAQASFPAGNSVGYVCKVYKETWDSGYYGDFGAIYVYTTSEPGCGGSYVGTGYMYSINATTSSSYSMYWIQDPALLGAELGALQRAAEIGQKVTIYVSSSYPLSIRYVQYHAN
jgi:hypothetical protein